MKKANNDIVEGGTIIDHEYKQNFSDNNKDVYFLPILQGTNYIITERI